MSWYTLFFLVFVYVSSDHLLVKHTEVKQHEMYNLERCHFKLSVSYYSSYHSYLATALWSSNGAWMWQHLAFRQREISTATIKSVAALVFALRSYNLLLYKQTDKWMLDKDGIFEVGNSVNKTNSGVPIELLSFIKNFLSFFLTICNNWGNLKIVSQILKLYFALLGLFFSLCKLKFIL